MHCVLLVILSTSRFPVPEAFRYPTATGHSWHSPQPTRRDPRTPQRTNPRTEAPIHAVAAAAIAGAFLCVPERSRPQTGSRGGESAVVLAPFAPPVEGSGSLVQTCGGQTT